MELGKIHDFIFNNFTFFFILLFILVSFLIPKLSSWPRLKKTYLAKDFGKKGDLLQSHYLLFMKIGWLNSSSAINLHIFTEGLLLSPKFPLGLLLPQLFFPYSSLTNIEFSEGLFKKRIFRASIDGVSLEIHNKSVDLIQDRITLLRS